MKPKSPSLLDIFLGFVYVGLSSIGGAAGPLRYVLVVRRKWLSEGEFSEVFGIAQVLPGATGANVAAMVADRFGRLPAVFAGLAGFCLPSMFVAIGLLAVATTLSASSPRFVAAETAVTAAVAGLFIGNGTRLARDLWTRAHDRRRWRTARLGIAVTGIILIVAYHVWIPAAVLILASLSLALEWAEREAERRQAT